MTQIEIHCPLCRRYLGVVTADMRGSAIVRIPCPKCKGEANERITTVQTTSREPTS